MSIIACKCLNVIATIGKFDKNIDSRAEGSGIDDGSSSLQSLVDTSTIDLKKYQRNAKFYTECMEFLRQAIEPVTDLSTTISQIDLVFNVPINNNNLLINYCINCNTITHAKNLLDAINWINSTLLTNSEEIAQRKTDQAYSSIFGILMINHQRLSPSILLNNSSYTDSTTTTSTAKTIKNFFFNMNNKSGEQNRLKNLNKILQQRLQTEISETDERIRRYTEQQFALLKSFREKSEQEYQILVSLVNQVPDELKQIDAIDSSCLLQGTTNHTTEGSSPTINHAQTSAIDNNTQSSSSLFSILKQTTNFDTPPATPDSTPMSVGNSPTFRQQTSVFANGRNGVGAHGGSFGINSKGINDNDDCLFDLEGIENYPISTQMGGYHAMSDVEETEDAEDALGDLDSGIPISRGMKRTDYSIAKSLPIAIAKSFDGKPQTNNAVDFEDEFPEDNVDIAASIKALAKSVHGDTVFGDLPRPRFSTQI